MQNGDILTIAFDSKEDDNTRDCLFFDLELPAEGIQTRTLLRLAGTMTAKVVDAEKYAGSHVPESTLASIVLSGLSAAMVQRGLNRGTPELLPAHSAELGAGAAASFAEIWRTHAGLEPGELTLDTVELSPLGKILVDRAREQKKKEPAAPAGEGGWTCACGQVNTGNFCTECGRKRP